VLEVDVGNHRVTAYGRHRFLNPRMARSLCGAMHAAARSLVLCLAACTGHRAVPPDEAVVHVVDAAGRPVAGAVVWTMPREAMRHRNWIPAELRPYVGNTHALIRRLGSERVADDAGVARVPRDTILAGEHAGLAAVTTVGAAADSHTELVLHDARWTIEVRDKEGMPAAGVPVTCAPEEDRFGEEFEGIPLGLTDADGRLVVGAPDSVDVAQYMTRPVGGPDPAPPAFVLFEVDGMYLDPHAQKLSLAGRAAGTVTLTLPPVTKVEVCVPTWQGPMAAVPSLTRIGKTMHWDNVECWIDSGRYFALVGVTEPRHPTPIVATIAGTTIQVEARVPRLPAGETFRIEVPLDPGDSIVRALVRDATGRPASPCLLQVTESGAGLRSRFVPADRDGRIAVVLGDEAAHGAVLGFMVTAGPNPEWLKARAEWKVDRVRPGDDADAGVITLDW
jgi:hypothetical protein